MPETAGTERPLRIVFMGTPSFAVPTLEALIKAGHEVVAAVTQPDKPKGRGLEKGACPVKAIALKNDIEVLEPVRLKEGAFIDKLKALSPEVVVVVAYGRILPESVLNIPPKGCINVHASLLPKYRGAGPINWAIINGESETGVSIMLMDKGMDTGPVFVVEKTPIEDNDTAESLSKRLSVMGAGLLARTIGAIAGGRVKPVQQDDGIASYAPLLKKEDGHIDWRRSSREVHNLVRGVYPWPGAYTHLKGMMLKVHSGREAGEGVAGVGGVRGEAGEPGSIIGIERGVITVKCSQGAYEVIEVQPENKKRMMAAEFVRGYRVKAGERFS